jgi:S1-C subfamily serine protease
MKYVLLVLTLLALAVAPAVASVPDDLQRVSVTIKAGSAQGSGTLVTRKIGEDTVTFVWTAAHVVDGLRTTRTVVTPQGTPRILVEYRDAEIVQERQQDGRRVGEVKYDCKVVKVSDADYGEDLALLMVRCKGAYPLNICAKFHRDTNYIPPIGIELSHCGSLLGQFGANSYTTGVLSQTGRTLAMKGANTKVFDQVTAVAFPGSSGGGMFLKENGEYIGMLTQGVTKLQGFNFIVPVRRIHSWAKDAKIEWAMNPDVPMPTLKEIDAIPVEDAGQSPGGYPQRNPAGGPPDEGAAAVNPPFDFNDAINWVSKFVRSAGASQSLSSCLCD